MAKAIASYPNKAPDLRKNPQIFEIWVERLATIDPERGLRNLDIHIDNNPDWFPLVGNIIRNDLIDISPNHEILRLETAEQFALLENWSKNDEPPPDGFWDNLRKKIWGEQA